MCSLHPPPHTTQLSACFNVTDPLSSAKCRHAFLMLDRIASLAHMLGRVISDGNLSDGNLSFLICYPPGHQFMILKSMLYMKFGAHLGNNANMS